MISMLSAVLAMVLATVGAVYTAGASLHLSHMALSAVAALIIAALAYYESSKAAAAKESSAYIGALNARFMGLVWTWGALVLFATYGPIEYSVLQWKEWWQFLGAAAAFAVLCFVFAAMLHKEARSKGLDSKLLSGSRLLAKVQLGGMIIAMLGLLVDGKMLRYLTPRYTDWAANNVFFFGAMALAIISYIAIRFEGKKVE